MNYKLTKTAKGKKFLYVVTDENGSVVSTRTSTRDYVACTANGDFYYGRFDLIDKGDRKKLMEQNRIRLLSLDYYWEHQPTIRSTYKTIENYRKLETKRINAYIKRLESIAYLGHENK